MRGRYNAAISACVKGWLGQSALLLLGRMEQNALEANVISYNAAIWFLLLAIAPLSANVISYNAAISAGVKGWSTAGSKGPAIPAAPAAKAEDVDVKSLLTPLPLDGSRH